MPKHISQADLEPVITAVGRFTVGASVREIHDALARDISRRTLQRRLAALVKSGALVATGHGPGTRYRVQLQSVPDVHAEPDARSPAQAAVPSNRSYPAQAETLRLVPSPSSIFRADMLPAIAFSDESLKLRGMVAMPMQARQRVGYRQAFLAQYQPNRTFYLDEATRADLLRAGQSVDARPGGTYENRLYKQLILDLSWNSSRLEGNTYSLLETERLVTAGVMASGHDPLDARMILNHKAAIEALAGAAECVTFNSHSICGLHALLSEQLLSNSAACGQLRQIAVGIGGSVYEPLDNPVLMNADFQLTLEKAAQITDPFEQAFFALVHLSYLQPFEDVNKRTSRLAANIPLIKNKLCPLSFVDVPMATYIEAMLAVYELNRVELLQDLFVWAYDRCCRRYMPARQVIGEPDALSVQYGEQITDLVTQVVFARLNKGGAARHIRDYAESNLSPWHKGRFVEAVETWLLNLHEGNIICHHIRPPEFERWQANWH